MRLAAWYDFAGQGTLAARNGNGPTLGFTRSGQARREDDSGWIRTVESGEPRFLGAPFTHNLQLSSNDFSVGGDWTKLNSSVVQNTIDAFGNENNAWTVTSDGAGAGVEFVGLRGDGFISGIPVGHTGLCSIDVKALNAEWVTMYGLGNAGSNDVWFNIVDGYVGTQEANVIDAGVIDLKNGWKRVWFVQEVSGGDSRMYISAADGDGIGGWTNTSSQDVFEASRGMAENVSGAWVADNTALWSQDFKNLSGNGVTHPDVIAAPDGTITADRINDDGSDTGQAQFQKFQTITHPSPGRYICSVSVKEDQLSWAFLNLTNISAQSLSMYADLANGVLGNVGADVIDQGIISEKDGWYRMWYEYEVFTTDLSGQLRLYLAEANSDSNVPSNGTSSIFAWGMVVERKKPNQVGPGAYARTLGSPSTEYAPNNYLVTDTNAVTFSTGPCEGLMVEDTRVNLLLQSDSLDVTWTPTNVTVTADQTLAPDGSMTADFIVPTAVSSTGHLITQTATIANATAYTLSVWAKAESYGHLGISLGGGGFAGEVLALFDIASGTLLDSDDGTVATLEDSGYIDYGNGWKRFWIKSTSVSTSATIRIYPVADSVTTVRAANDGYDAYVPDGTSGVYMWRAVLEAGAFPSSGIRTAGGTTTRNAETEISGAIQSDVRDAHTLYAEYQLLYSTNCLSGYVLHVNDGTLSNSVGILSRNTLGYQCLSATTAGGGAPTAIDSVGSLTHTAALKGAFGFAENNSEWYVDGVRVLGGDQTVDILGNDISQIRVGSRVGGGNQISNGLIKEVRWYDMRMTEDQLAKMGQTPSIMPGYDKTKMRKQKAIDAAIWNKAMNARTREARSESEEDYVPYNNIG